MNDAFKAWKKELNPNLYENGTPFLEWDTIKFNFEKFINAVDKKKPIVIVIGGPQSSAKTTESIHFGDAINFLTDKPEINLNDLNCVQYCQGSKNFLRKLNEAKEQGFRIIIWDETASDYRRKRAISNINKTLDEAMDMIRIFRMIVILVYHDFQEIPKELINKKVITCLFENEDRNIEKNYVVSKAYNYGKMCIIKENLKKNVIREYAFKSVSPNFAVHFKDLSPQRSAQLEKLSSNIKYKIFEKAEISMSGYLDQEAISDKLGMSKAWVRKKIKDLGIKEERILQKIKYYNANITEKLRNKIKQRANSEKY